MSERMRGLRHQVEAMRQAWPEGETFAGSDATGALTVTVDSHGRATHVALAADWVQRIGERALARAVNEALGQASARLGARWLETWHQEPAARVGAEEADRPRVHLASWTPARTEEDLRRIAERAAAVRAREARYLAGAQGVAERESFESPRALLQVTRSHATLVGLEPHPGIAANTPADELGDEIVDALAEIERRSSAPAALTLDPRAVTEDLA